MFLERFRKIADPEGTSCLPIIDYEKCKSCQRCYLICPAGTLEWVDNKPQVIKTMKFGGEHRHSTCLGCRDCVAVCRESAISVQGSLVPTKGYYRHRYPYREIRPPEPMGPGKSFEEIAHDLTDVEKVIYRRRSNRVFKKKPVPHELIQRILESARFAPSGGNNQPVRYIVIEDQAVIHEIKAGVGKVLDLLTRYYMEGGPISRFFLKIYGFFNPGQLDIRPMYSARAFMDPNTKIDLFHNAPCFILVLGDQRGVGKYQLDCGIAAEHIVLTAHSLGLGTCYVGFIEPLNLLPRLKRMLGIEYPYKVVASIAVGYPKFKQDREVPREVTPIVWFKSKAPLPDSFEDEEE